MSTTPDGTQPRVHYIHRTSYTFQERLVGAFVLSALALGLVMFAYSREAATMFAKKFTLAAQFKNAQGLAEDAKVEISGVEVGRVRSIGITESNEIRVELELLERFHPLVREDSKAAMSKLALIGKANIEIRAGNPARPQLPDGATLPVEEPLSLEQIMADIAPVVQNFTRLLERLNQSMETLDPRDVGTTLKSLQATLANTEKITGQIAAGRGAAGRLLSDPDVERDLATSMRLLASTLAEAERQVQALAPVMDNTQAATGDVRLAARELPDLMVRTRLLMEQINLTLRAVQGTWPLSASVPQPAPQLVVQPGPMQ
ncbi:MAG: MCE family protein [Gammaproteobacteria bacterium]|nr:MCE family protein [Gammaproteobacteria bacterium]